MAKPKRQHKSETLVTVESNLALSAAGFRVWRNNVGAYVNKHGGLTRHGLKVGSGDWIGIIPPWGIFLSVEYKSTTGTPTDAQREWRDLINSLGGIAIVANDAADAVAQINSRLTEMLGPSIDLNAPREHHRRTK